MEPRTLRYLMTANRLFEETQNRAFMLAGYYPLTYGTIGPVSKSSFASGLVALLTAATDTNPVIHLYQQVPDLFIHGNIGHDKLFVMYRPLAIAFRTGPLFSRCTRRAPRTAHARARSAPHHTAIQVQLCGFVYNAGPETQRERWTSASQADNDGITPAKIISLLDIICRIPAQPGDCINSR